jgi:hypothetical protein
LLPNGSSFFLYLSYIELGRIIPAGVLELFYRNPSPAGFTRPKSWFCWVGVAPAIVLLFIFKNWNFFAGLV